MIAAPLRSSETRNGSQICPPSPRATAANREAMILSATSRKLD
jgi:hypothetical protein